MDLIFKSYESNPPGTLPPDNDGLADLVRCEPRRFRELTALSYGPLHKWERCLSYNGEVRLYHPFVLRKILEALAGRQANQARGEANARSMAVTRLCERVAGFDLALSKNSAAILWMDDWLREEGCGYRTATWIQRAMTAWSNEAFNRSQRGSGRSP